MTSAETAVLVDRWFQAWRRLDTDALAELYAPNSVLEGPIAGTLTGRDAIRSFFRSMLDALPDLVFSDEQVVLDENRAAIFWTASGTHRGSLFGSPASGRPLVFRCAGLFTFGVAGIEQELHRFDFTALLVQAGVFRLKPT